VGAEAGLYILFMSISGSIIVYRNELSRRFSIEWLIPPIVFTHEGLSWLAQSHCGRFGGFAQALRILLGLVPAILAFHRRFYLRSRVMYQKPSNPNVVQASRESIL